MDLRELARLVPAGGGMYLLLPEGETLLHAGERLYDSLAGVVTSMLLKGGTSLAQKGLGFGGFNPLSRADWQRAGIELTHGIAIWFKERGSGSALCGVRDKDALFRTIEQQWKSMHPEGACTREGDTMALAGEDGALLAALVVEGGLAYAQIGSVVREKIAGIPALIREGARLAESDLCKDTGLLTCSRGSLQCIGDGSLGWSPDDVGGLEDDLAAGDTPETAVPTTATETPAERPLEGAEPQEPAKPSPWRLGVKVHEDGISLDSDFVPEGKRLAALHSVLLPVLRGGGEKSFRGADGDAVFGLTGVNPVGLIAQIAGEEMQDLPRLKEMFAKVTVMQCAVLIFPIETEITKFDPRKREDQLSLLSSEHLPAVLHVRTQDSAQAKLLFEELAIVESERTGLRIVREGDRLTLSFNLADEEEPVREIALHARVDREHLVVGLSRRSVDTALSRAGTAGWISLPKTESFSESRIVLDGAVLAKNLRELAKGFLKNDRPVWNIGVDKAADLVARIPKIEAKVVARKRRCRIGLDIEIV